MQPSSRGDQREEEEEEEEALVAAIMWYIRSTAAHALDRFETEEEE